MRKVLRGAGFLICMVILLFTGAVQAVEIWSSYTSMDDPRDIEYFNGAIWGAAEGGIFRFKLADSTFQIFTLADGLRGEKFYCLAVDSTGKVWSSGTGGAMNIYDSVNGWLQSLTFLEDEVNDIVDLAIDGNSVFAAADNGVYEFYYESLYDEYFVRGGYHQLGDFQVGESAQAVYVHDGYLWVGTGSGVARIELSIVDKQPFFYWENFTTAQGLPSANIVSFTVVDDTLYAASKTAGLARFEGDEFSPIPISNNQEIKRIHSFGDTIYAAASQGVKRLEEGMWKDVGEQVGKCYYLAEDQSGTLWAAKANGLDGRGGLIGFDGANWNDFRTNTPAGNYIKALEVDSQGRLWCGGGASMGKGVYVYDGFDWVNYTAQDSAYDVYFYTNGSGPQAFLEYLNGEMWSGSYGSGVAVFEPNGEQFYFNSIDSLSQDSIARLAGIPADPTYCVAGEMALDDDGNIWLVNRASGEKVPLLMVPADFMNEIDKYSPNIDWLEFSASDIGAFSTDDPYFDYLVIDREGRLWMGSNSGDSKGITCYNFNGTPYNKSDDVSLRFTISNELLENTIYDLTIDSDNRLWVATGAGVSYLDIPPYELTTSGGLYFETPYILEGIKTNCVAVDPMNNKWFGTDNGIILVAEDYYYEPLEVYTAETNPLLDNQILDIVINGATGEVFIATPKGISSLLTPYRDFSAELGKLELYPIPFYPGEGDLLRFGATSLTPDAVVKIFTHTGLLVKKLPFVEASLGWDGTDSEDELVGSGIYLVLVTSPDGQSVRSKVPVIRR